MIRIGLPRRARVILVCLMLGGCARLAQAEITQALPPAPQRFGSNHIVIQLTEPYARALGAERARTGDRLMRTAETIGSPNLVAAMQRWNVAGMRPVFEFGFADENLARAHGLDRYFILEAPAGTDVSAMASRHSLTTLCELASYVVQALRHRRSIIL